MKKTRIIALVLALVFCFALSACGGGDSKTTETVSPATGTDAGTETAAPVVEDESFTWSVSYFLGADSNLEIHYIKPWCEAIEAATNGTVTFDLYPGGTLTAADATLDGVKTDVCDVGLVLPAYYPGELPYCYMMEYPIGWSSAASCNHAFLDYIEALQPDELDGTVFLSCYNAGDGIIVSHNKISSVEDLQGLELRTNAVAGEWLLAAGGVPMTMPSGESYEAIRSGLCNGFLGALEAIANLKLYEVTENATYLDFWNSSYMMLLNEDKWNALSDNQRAQITAAMDAFNETDAPSFMESAGAQGIDGIVNAGHEITFLDEEADAEFLALGEQICRDYADLMDSQGYDGSGAYDMIMSMREKYNPMYPDRLNASLNALLGK